MRSGRSVALILSSLLVLTGWVKAEADPGAKTTNGYAVSSSWMGDSRSSHHDNGRRLAFVLPMVPSSASAKVPFIQPKHPGKPQVISVTVPANVGQAIDSCSTAARKLTAVGLEKANQVGAWLGVFFKQMNHAPVLTPVGGPYAFQASTPTIQSKFQLWYMRDGRLKTVVSR